MRPGEGNNGFLRGSSKNLTGTNISRDTHPALVHPTLCAAPDVSPDAAGAGAGAGADVGAVGGDGDMDQESSGTTSAESVRRRRCSSRGARISEQAAISAWTATPGPKGAAVLLATSGADPGTDAAGDAQDRIDFKGFRTRVEGAKEAGGKEREGRNTAAADAAAAEARTPPAMERNLFLSALANGRIEVMEMHLPLTTPSETLC